MSRRKPILQIGQGVYAKRYSFKPWPPAFARKVADMILLAVVICLVSWGMSLIGVKAQ